MVDVGNDTKIANMFHELRVKSAVLQPA